MPTLYGIRNCDTVRKARRWLNSHGVDHAWHDFRIDGLPEATLERWLAMVGAPGANCPRRPVTDSTTPRCKRYCSRSRR
jgi:arsenate reductase-like glutaredoxin family protein